MNNVAESHLPNASISGDLRKFVIQVDSSIDVWVNCDRPDWMLALLKMFCNSTGNYQYNGGLMKYIDCLKEMLSHRWDDPNDVVDYSFSYQQGVSSIENEVKSSKINHFEGDRRCFIWLWSTALETTRHVFEEKVARFEFNRFAEKIISEHTGVELIPDHRTEIDYRRCLLRKQANLLRAAIVDPFRYVPT